MLDARRMNPLLHLFRLTLAFVFLCAYLAGTAHAELLQRFHILDFKVTSDTPRPRVGVPFHVTLTIRVRERVTQLQYVYVPTFPGLQNLGDRRLITHAPGDGSTYRETLTLVAHKPGPTAIGSAYLDAVDLRDSKTKRFFSNDLILNVAGAMPSARAPARAVALAILALLLLIAGAILAATMLRRRRAVAAKSETALKTAVPPPRAPPIGLHEALATLRIRRDRSSVMGVRETLWSIAGANQGDTLGDVLQREPAGSDGLRSALIAIERAAFIHDTHLQQAIDNALFEGEHISAR
jgi:hypothetical protein